MTNNTPPDPAVLRELIERVEAADAEMQGALLEEAWEACAEADQAFRRFACAPCSGFGTNGGRFGSLMDARAYLDAAMMLAPTGWRVRTEHGDSYSCASFVKGYGNRRQVMGFATSERPDSEIALALCAASLRAHTSTPTMVENGNG